MEKPPKIKKFEDLVVWQKALMVCKGVYLLSSTGPLARDIILKIQLRRGSLSIISNIAEGFGRYGYQEFRHFLSIANGSSLEVRAQLHLVRELGYASNMQLTELIDKCTEVSRMLRALRTSPKLGTQA